MLKDAIDVEMHPVVLLRYCCLQLSVTKILNKSLLPALIWMQRRENIKAACEEVLTAIPKEGGGGEPSTSKQKDMCKSLLTAERQKA